MFYKSKIRSSFLKKPTSSLPFSYWLLVILRIILSLVQNGYIHPDEYFQSLEVIAGDIFNIDATRTWEFNTTFPLRNIMLPSVMVGSSYMCMKAINPYTNYYFNINLKSPYLLVAIPRLLFCMISFLNDYCIYKICLHYRQNYRNRLVLLASSYIVLVYTSHTFSNSLEVALFSILLLYVSKCMLKSDRTIYHNEFLLEKYKNATSIVDKVKIYKLKSTLPEHSLDRCLEVSSVAVLGIFNRPTFLGYACPPVFFWLNRGLGSKFIGFKEFHIRILTLVLFGIPSLLFLIITDSVYYGYFTIAELESLKISLSNFVVTPLNFLKYNLLSDNLSEHGVHPRWLHIVVNIPLLFNVLGIIAILHTSKSIYRILRGFYSQLPRIQSITGLMLFSFMTPLLVLSIFPHQEPRFLIPILIPVVYLYGPYIFPNDQDTDSIKKTKRSLFVIWCICNAFLTLFYGFIHQGGVFYLTKNMHSELLSKPKSTTVHLITSHIYDIPQSLLLMDSTSKLWFDRKTGQKYRLKKQILVYQYGSVTTAKLIQEIKSIHKINDMKQRTSSETFRLYLSLPTSLLQEFYDGIIINNSTDLDIYHKDIFWPHLSTEAFPNFPSSDDFSCTLNKEPFVGGFEPLSFFQRFKCFLGRFSLSLIKITDKLS